MTEPRDEVLQQRAGRLAWIMALLFAAVALRLVDLQVLLRSSLLAKAERQQFTRVEVPGHRGTITDRHGQPLAISVATESVFCSAGLVKPAQRARVARALASTLGVSETAMRRHLAQGKGFYVKRDCRLEATARLKELKLNCLSYSRETKRIYPQGRLACHVLGFINVDGKGMDGVELSYQDALAGRPGVAEDLRDAAGREIPNQREWLQRPKDGANLRLTLDASLQHIAERELGHAVRKFKAKGGAVVLMDPHDGEILALASYPDYAPADPGASIPDHRRDRAISDAFEPGSTFKAVTASLLMERGLVAPDTPVDCHHGRLKIFGRVVRDYGTDHMGVVPFSQVIAQSSNCGTVVAAQKLGPRLLYEGMVRFGFGQLTGVDLPGEVVGMLRPLDKWTPGSMAAIPFGQEFSCTLMRMVVTYAAVANGGHLVRPHVVQGLVSASGGSLVPDRNGSTRQVMPERVRQQLVGILEGVVKGGTGVAIALPGYTIAGKTGTAQKFNRVTGRYSKHLSVSSFVGFAPAESPAFVAGVMLDEPQGLDLGGWTAGPVFRTLMSAALTAYGVPPSQKILAAQAASAEAEVRQGGKDAWTAMYRRGAQAEPIRRVRVPNLNGMTEWAARTALAKAGLSCHIVGSGRVIGQYPRARTRVLGDSTVSLALGAPTAGRPAAIRPGLWSRLFGKR